MNDRHLFKAKRVDNGEWVIGDLSHHKTGKIFIKPLNGSASSSCEVDKDTICQYTGLTDKNGQKIWENDVVKKEFYTDYDAFANSEEYIGVVKYEDCAWCVYYERNGYKCNSPIFMAMKFHDAEHFDVIGNIFDNPELLESEE